MKCLFTSLVILNLALLSGLAWGASSYEEGVADLSKAIVTDAAKFKKQKLAVVDFTDLSGNVTELGRFLAEELSVSLVITGAGLEIVDRTQLNKILREQALSFSGVIDPAAVKKVGQLAGVDALIAGTITDLEDTIRLTMKIIATDTGSLVSAARTTIPKTGTITKLMAREVAPPRMPGLDRPEADKEARVQPDAPKTGRATKCKIRQQEQDSVVFCLEQLSRSPDKKVISTVFSVTNTREKPVIITFVKPYASVLDDKTNTATVFEINGIVPCLN